MAKHEKEALETIEKQKVQVKRWAKLVKRRVWCVTCGV